MNIITNHKSFKFIIHSNFISVLQSSTEQKYTNSSHHKTPRQNEHFPKILGFWWMTKILLWSNTKQAPPYTRYHRWVAGRLQKKKKSNTLQISHWFHPHNPLTPSKEKKKKKKREDIPICSTCKVPLTVKYILINWDRFRQTCSKHYQTSNLKGPLQKHQIRGNLEHTWAMVLHPDPH